MASVRKGEPAERADSNDRRSDAAGRALQDSEFVVQGADGRGRMPLDRALRSRIGGSWESARRLVRTGKVRVDDMVVMDPTTLVADGTRVAIRMAAPKPQKPQAIGESDVVYVDAHVVVVEKPAGISTVRHPTEPITSEPLDELVRAFIRRTHRGGSVGPLGVVQRLDKETSGLLVFTRTVSARDALRRQFRDHSVHRRYVAVAHGSVAARTFSSWLVEDRGDGLRGSTTNPKLGRNAVTHVRVIERLRGATLVECALETGRTHQIRIHLSEAGHPIVGDRVYVREFAGPTIAAPRLMLHAAELGFLHPHDGRPMEFVQAVPDDMARLIDELRTPPR